MSYARSPRELCSITIGISMRSPPPVRGPCLPSSVSVASALRGYPEPAARAPDRFAGTRGVDSRVRSPDCAHDSASPPLAPGGGRRHRDREPIARTGRRGSPVRICALSIRDFFDFSRGDEEIKRLFAAQIARGSTRRADSSPSCSRRRAGVTPCAAAMLLDLLGDCRVLDRERRARRPPRRAASAPSPRARRPAATPRASDRPARAARRGARPGGAAARPCRSRRSS